MATGVLQNALYYSTGQASAPATPTPAGESVLYSLTADKKWYYKTDAGNVKTLMTLEDAQTVTGVLTLTTPNIGAATGASLTLTSGAALRGSTIPASGSGIELHYGLTASTGSILAYNRTGGAYLDMEMQGNDLYFKPSGIMILKLSNTGPLAAITGNQTISGTLGVGTGTTTTAGLKLINGTAGFDSGYGAVYPENVTASATNYALIVKTDASDTRLNAASGHVYLTIANTGIVDVVSTGAAVTGTLGVTGAISPGNTVNVVSPTSPNRTVTMVVGGVTLYIAAKTTND